MMFNSIEQKVFEEKEEKIDWQEKVKMEFPFSWPFRLAAIQTAERIINNKLPSQDVDWEKIYQVCKVKRSQVFSTLYNSEQATKINQCYQQFIQGDPQALDKIYWFDNVRKPLSLNQLLERLRNTDCKLMSLRLCNNYIGVKEAEEMAEILMNSNCQLMHLDLSNTRMKIMGVKKIVAALKNPNCKLSCLHLNFNEIGDKGAEEISIALMNPNCKLSFLYLLSTQIGDAGVKEISIALKNPNCKLSSLYLSSDQIGDNAAKEISIALINPHCKLTLLNLSCNQIGKVGARAIAIAQKNKGYPCNLNIKLGEQTQSYVTEFNYQWREAQKLYALFSHSNKNSQHLSVLPPFITVHCLFPYLYDIFKDELKEQAELKEVSVMKYIEEMNEGKTIKKEKWILVKGEVPTGELVYPQSRIGSTFLAAHDRHFVDVLGASRLAPK